MIKAIGLIAVLAAGIPAIAQNRLEIGQALSAHLEPGHTDAYPLELASDDYLELRADQTGVDLILRLSDPDGKQVEEVNFLGYGGSELLIYLAEKPGRYTLAVLSAHPDQSGAYTLRLVAQRPATPNDRAAAKADAQLRLLAASNQVDSAPAAEQLAPQFERLGIRQRQALCFTVASTLRGRGNDFEAKVAGAQRALALWAGLKEPAGEGYVLNLLGRAYLSRSQYDKAIETGEKARVIGRDLGNGPIEATALQIMSVAYTRTGQPEKTVANQERAAAIWRGLKERGSEAAALSELGYAHFALTHHEVAVGYYEQALAISQEVGNLPVQASVLNGLGIVYRELSQYQKAIDAYEQSLAIHRQLKDKPGEGVVIGNLGLLYATIGQYDKAIGYQQQSLQSARASKDRLGEGVELGLMGYTYRLLGDYPTAIKYYEQGLALARELKIRVGEGMALNELGNVATARGRYREAIGYYEQALPIERKAKNRAVEGWILDDLGAASLHLNQPEKAISYFEQSLEIAREIKDRTTEGDTINHLARAYLALHQTNRAEAYGQQALAIARQVKNRTSEHDALLGLMRTYQAAGQPRLAIFCGKQAVNLVQNLRSETTGLSLQARRSFLESKKDTFRTLANLLVSQGRLLEAQQVLNLLKERELSDYVREQRAASGRADLTAEESEWADRYRRISEVLVAKGAEMEDLRAHIKKHPSIAESPETQQEISGLQKDLEAGNQAFQLYLGELKLHFASKPDPRATSINLKEAEALKSDLADLRHGAVAIYTLVASDRYVAILITPRVERAYETKITPAELNQKILAFRQALEDPGSNPLPPAQDLYHVLIPPALAQDLKLARAQTVMWSLDGPLRYVPIVALHDGKRYFIEQYRTEVFTPASNSRLKEPPQAGWRAVGFGVTKGHPGFDPLPEVATELAGIVREKPGDRGVLQGRLVLDGQFTRAALDRELMLGYPVVHVASHFQFRPGDESRSFLLLGDGAQLTLADLKTADTMFAGVDLLTLSACSTGLGDLETSDGSEVEGFGALAQRKGAKAVIASLWSVADTSTAVLMREFYRARERNPSLTKLEALRAAQLSLLGGTIDTRDLTPELRPAEKTQWSHPFYWAPFFLMGNWL